MPSYFGMKLNPILPTAAGKIDRMRNTFDFPLPIIRNDSNRIVQERIFCSHPVGKSSMSFPINVLQEIPGRNGCKDIGVKE